MMTTPPIARVRQSIPQPRLEDVAGTVANAIRASRIAERVPAGGTIAVGVGSRGIHALPVIARAAVDTLKGMGYRPFLVAAMGSHGGATAEGQRALLAGHGLTEEAMGVEIRTNMETVVVGTSPAGLPIHFDRNAFEADGIVLINRIKPHTDFRGRYESGLVKMLVIGLGKQEGAAQIHRLGLRGMTELMPAVGRTLAAKAPLALGLAVLENADDEPAEVVAIEPEELFDVEPVLLERSRGLMGRLPFEQLDVLIVGELGKNYSGSGLDPNVIGRRMIETTPDLDRPTITRLAVLDASPESHGNIVGVGFADLITERLAAALDPVPFRVNVLTACYLERARIPITLPTDRAVIETALETCWRLHPEEIRLAIIPNTLELKTFWASPALEDEIRAHPHLGRETDYGAIPYKADDTLDQVGMFPESLRGRRSAATRPH